VADLLLINYYLFVLKVQNVKHENTVIITVKAATFELVLSKLIMLSIGTTQMQRYDAI
jgi:hypothetical protein